MAHVEFGVQQKWITIYKRIEAIDSGIAFNRVIYHPCPKYGYRLVVLPVCPERGSELPDSLPNLFLSIGNSRRGLSRLRDRGSRAAFLV